jgi:hypothetical protein
MYQMTNCRSEIIRTFAGWTALSALRSGAPVKSRREIYPLLATVDFDAVLQGSTPILYSEFDLWHEVALDRLCTLEPRLSTGWAAKLINVYLKTTSYVGELGRPGIRAALHPPIDAGLWSGLRRRFANDAEVLAQTHVVQRIRDIRDVETYHTIIAGCRKAAEALGCTLLEVEQLWEGAAANVAGVPAK